MFFPLSLSTDRCSFSVENHYISSSAIPAALISSLLKNLRFIIKHPEMVCSSLPISLLVPYAPIPLNHTTLIVQKIFTTFVTNTDLTTLNSENMMLLKHFHKSFRKRILQLSTSIFSANASYPYPLITSSTISAFPSSSSTYSFVAPEAVSEGLLESSELETMAWISDPVASPKAVSPFTYLTKYEDPFKEDSLLIADPLLPQMPDPLTSDSSPFNLYETSSSSCHYSLKASDEEKLMSYSNNSDKEEMIIAPPPAIKISAIAPKKPTKRPRTQVPENEDSSSHKRPRIQAPPAPLPSTSTHKQVKSKTEPTPALTKKRAHVPEKPLPFFCLRHKKKTYSIQQRLCYPFNSSKAVSSPVLLLLDALFFRLKSIFKYVDKSIEKNTPCSLIIPQTLLPLDFPETPSGMSVSSKNPLFYWSLATLFLHAQEALEKCYDRIPSSGYVTNSRTVRLTKINDYIAKCKQAYENLGGQIPGPSHRSNPLFSSSPFITDSDVDASITLSPSKQKKASHKTAFTQSLGNFPYPLLKANPLLPYDEPIASSLVAQTTEKTPFHQQSPIPFLRSDSSEKDNPSPAVEMQQISPSSEVIEISLQAKKVWGPILIFMINDASQQPDIRVFSCWPTPPEQLPISPHPAASVLTSAARKTSCLLKKIETLLKTKSPKDSLQLPPELFALPLFKKQPIIYRNHPLFYWLLACILSYTKEAIEKFYNTHIPLCENTHSSRTKHVKQAHQMRMEKISATIRNCQTIHQQINPEQTWLAFPDNPLITQTPHCLHCQHLIDPTISTTPYAIRQTSPDTKDPSSFAATLHYQDKATLQSIRTQQSLFCSIRQHMTLTADEPQPVYVFSIDCHGKIPKIKILDCKAQMMSYKNPKKNTSTLPLSPFLEISFKRLNQTMKIIRERFLNAPITNTVALTVPSYILPLQHLTPAEEIQNYNSPLLGWILITLLSYSKDSINKFYEKHKDTFISRTHSNQIARNRAIDACIAECYAKYPHLKKDDPTLTAQPNILIASESLLGADLEAPSTSTSSASKTSSIQQPLQKTLKRKLPSHQAALPKKIKKQASEKSFPIPSDSSNDSSS